MKLLLVDDDPAGTEMLQGHFSVRSYGVLTARTAMDAPFLAFHEKPDAVILDLRLPDFPGQQVLQTLKKLLPWI